MRIWVTGIGIISPLAPTSRGTMDRLCEGAHAFGPVTLFDATGQRSLIAAEVADLHVADLVPKGVDADGWSRTDALAIHAAREALEEARANPSHDPIDLVLGTTTGATFETEGILPDLLSDDTIPLSAPILHPLSLALEHLALALGPFRRRRLVSSACSTGANVLLLASAWIRSGFSKCVLAGASDSLCRLTFTGFNALGSLDPAPCRPFDSSRAGLGLGEGAAFLVIEREDHARDRGVEPIAEIVGSSAGAEAHHITNPEPLGTIATRTMTRAMSCAGLTPNDIDYVNAHGTATALNDPMEIGAIRRALGSAFERVAISSIKGQIGHSLGAAGAVEAAITALAIAQQRVPPTTGLTHPADDCQANHVIGVARSLPVRAAITNSFGFGGLDGVVVLARPGFAPEQVLAHRTSVWVRGGAMVLRDGLVSLGNESWTGSLEPSSPGPLGDAWTTTLDAARARRLARPERLLATVVDAVKLPKDGRSTGIVAAKASGNPEATARFLDRIRQKGPRFASPADFPNLMLSSLAGHVSIYHHLQGSALATASFTHPGVSSILTAWELLASGIPDRLFAGAVDDWDLVAKRNPTVHTEGAATVLLDTDGSEALARCSLLRSVEELPLPGATARVLHVGEADLSVLENTPWNKVQAVRAEDRMADNDVLAVAALLLAVAWVHERTCNEVALLVAGDDGDAILTIEAP